MCWKHIYIYIYIYLAVQELLWSLSRAIRPLTPLNRPSTHRLTIFILLQLELHLDMSTLVK